jgi:hypothetical protein
MADQLFTINNKLNTNNADVIFSYDHEEDSATYYFFDPKSGNWTQVYLASTSNSEGETPEINIDVITSTEFLGCFTTDIEDIHWLLRQVSKSAIQAILDKYPDSKEYRDLFRNINPEAYTDYLEKTL